MQKGMFDEELKIQRNKTMRESRGFTLVEVMIALVAVGLISAIGIPHLTPVKTGAEEAKAVANVRTLMTAQMTYSSTHPNGEFGTLEDLKAGGLINDLLASGKAGQYRYEVNPNGSRGFDVVALPDDLGGDVIASGFFGDETGVIREEENGNRPSGSSPPVNAGPGWAIIEKPVD